MEPAHRAVRLRELVLSGTAVYPVWTPAEHGFPPVSYTHLNLTEGIFFLEDLQTK